MGATLAFEKFKIASSTFCIEVLKNPMTLERTVGWGMWGTGKVAWDFSHSLRQVPHAQIVGVASRQVANAQAMAKNFGSHAFPSYEEMLRDPRIEIVYIATPPHRHFDDCMLALDHGKAILCEKPFALSVCQTKRIIEKAREKNLFCMEGMWMRFMPLMGEVRGLIQNGAIGKPLLMSGDFGYPLIPDKNSHLFDPKAGGGALLDRCIYLLSLSHSLFGVPDKVTSNASLGSTGVDEQSIVTLQYVDGLLVQASASLRTLGTNEVVIMGDQGTLKIHAPFFKPHKLSIQKFKPSRSTTPKSRTPNVNHAFSLRTLAQSQWVRSLYYPMEHILQWLRRNQGQVRLRPFSGYGYQFEANAATRCMLSGAIESEVMPHRATLEVMQMLEDARRSWVH